MEGNAMTSFHVIATPTRDQSDVLSEIGIPVVNPNLEVPKNIARDYPMLKSEIDTVSS